jgi:hypothetical protein
VLIYCSCKQPHAFDIDLCSFLLPYSVLCYCFSSSLIITWCVSWNTDAGKQYKRRDNTYTPHPVVSLTKSGGRRMYEVCTMCGHSPTQAIVTCRKVHRKWNWVYIWWAAYVYTRESRWNQKSNILGPDRRQHDHPATCAIAPQYSTTLISLRCHFSKQNFGTRFKRVIVSIYFVLLWKCLSLTLRNSKLSKFGSA